jgi:2-C-methyl-D-erythritol 4-phosphate cytidylyltransferase
MTNSLWIVIPAAGVGSRMNSCVPKQYLKIAGKTILQHTLSVFDNHPRVKAIVIALSDQDQYFDKLGIQLNTPLLRVQGGAERVNSVLNALNELQKKAQEDDWVLVHDAARPCLQSDDLDKLVNEVEQAVSENKQVCGGILAYPAKDTLKREDRSQQDTLHRIEKTVDRSRFWHALTPQMFRYQNLLQAMQSTLDKGIAVTDEASAMEANGFQPLLIQGRSDNIKVTSQEDLVLAEAILKNQWQTNSE